jgi:hypothetical protein
MKHDEAPGPALSTYGTPRSSTEDRTAPLRAEIERDRAGLSETVQAIQRRLQPEHLKEEARAKLEDTKQTVKREMREATVGRVTNMFEDVRGVAGRTGRGIGETMRSNPVPTAMMCAGAAWLFANRRGGGERIREPRRHYAYGYGTAPESESASGAFEGHEAEAGGVASSVRARAGEYVGEARERAGEMVHEAQESLGQVPERARDQVARAESFAERAWDRNPLALGAICCALGAAVGLALPRTEKEARLMGATRERIGGKLQEVAESGMSKMESAVQKMTPDEDVGAGESQPRML